MDFLGRTGSSGALTFKVGRWLVVFVRGLVNIGHQKYSLISRAKHSGFAFRSVGDAPDRYR